LLFIAIVGLASILNFIPLAALAAVLLMVGFKLTPPKLYFEVWRMGRSQFYPFISTVLAILLTDLLTGTLLGLGFALFFIVLSHYSSAVVVTDDGSVRLVRFVSSVSFLHKARIKEALENTPPGGHVVLDGTRARTIDPDIMEVIKDFQLSAKERGIEVSIHRSQSALHGYFREEVRA
jgi:MFS superfamily sulfate permease-like transporter